MEQDRDSSQRHRAASMYGRFAGMIATSSVLMYIFTYFNTVAWDHVFFSEERVYMTLMMTAMMAAVMLSFMLPMLKSRYVNGVILVAAAVLFGVNLWLVRTQALVQDIAYMKAMIPHHSIAILTSERSQIHDQRVRKLADEIIASQRSEISEMKLLIRDIETHGYQASK